MNENIGDIPCPFCREAAHVRRYNPRRPPKEGEAQRGRFYVHCTECGPILASSKRVQEYILERGKFYGAHKPDTVKAAQATKPPGPQGMPAQPADKPKRKVFDDRFFD